MSVSLNIIKPLVRRFPRFSATQNILLGSASNACRLVGTSERGIQLQTTKAELQFQITCISLQVYT
jgi:hypothetical protein